MVNSKYYISFSNRCLCLREVYQFFANLYPNRTFYRHICYSSKVYKIIKKIHRERVSINRIISIEYLIISKYFVITYYKRHYRRIGSIYIRP